MSKNKSKSLFRPAAHRFALESRQLFDGAAFVEAAAHDAQAPADDAHHADTSHPAPEAPVAHVAPAPLAEAAAARDVLPAVADQHAVYVVDQNVQDWQQVVGSLPAGAEVILIDPARDGVKDLAAAVAGRTDISSIYIISHGSAGEIVLGNTHVNAANISDHAEQWQAIGASLSADGDILLYGCDVAGKGIGLLTEMAELTGADVAASVNATGSAVQGGDWELEAQVGRIEAKAFTDADYAYLLAAPALDTTSKDLTVAEPSSLNATGADRVQLSGWTITKTGTTAVTVDAVLGDANAGTLTTAYSQGTTATIAGGLRFTGTVAQAQSWLNSITFTARDTELGTTAVKTTLTVNAVGTDAPGITVSRSIGITITPSNDAAVFFADTLQANEIGSTVITTAQLQTSDPEVTAGTQTNGQLVYVVGAPGSYGYLAVSGVRLGTGSTFTHADVVAGRVVYVHTATGANQNTSDSIGLQVNDGATPIAASASSLLRVNIVPLNQLPGVSGSGAVNEGQPANAVDGGGVAQSVVGNFITADGGGDDTNAQLSVRLTALPTDGTLYFTGTAILGGVSTPMTNRAITAADITAGFSFAYAARTGLTYGNNGQRDNAQVGSYPFNDGFNVVVSDAGGGTATPGVSADTRIGITVRAVNDDPTLTSSSTPIATVLAVGGATTGPVRGPLVVTLSTDMLNAADVDSDPSRVTFAVTSQAGLVHGRLLLNGQILPVGAVFTLADVQANRVQYIQQAGAGPNEIDTFTFQLVDNTFNPRWNPDGTSINRVGGVYRTQGTPEVGDDQLRTFTFTIALAPTQNGNGTGLPTQGQVIAQGDSNYAGTDGTGSSRGSLGEGGIVVLAGTGSNFASTPGLSYTVDGVPPEQVVYTILGFDGAGANWNGALQRQTTPGVWVTLNAFDTFTQADLNAGSVRFQHDGASEDFVSSMRLSASAGVLVNNNGTLQPDAWNTTFSFFVTPSNDAPVATGSSNTVLAEGATIGITTGQLGISDPDDATSETDYEAAATLPGLAGDPNYAFNNAATGPQALRFVVQTGPLGGKLQYSTNGGSTWADVVVGTTEINAASLTGDAATTGLRFVSDGSEVRSANFTVRAIDRWNAVSNVATVNLQITNVNDAPQIASDPTQADPIAPVTAPNQVGGASVNNPMTVSEGGFAQISSSLLQAYDPDSTSAQVQYRITTAPAHGTIAISTDGGLTFANLSSGSSFTQADVAAGRIYYRNNGDEGDGSVYPGTPSDQFIFDLADGNKEQTGNRFFIYVQPVNDAPVVTAPSAPISLDSAIASLNPVVGFSVADSDLANLATGESDFIQTTVRLLNANGTPFTAAQYAELGGVQMAVSTVVSTDSDKNGVNDFLTISGTRAQVNAALASLTVTFGSDRDQVFQVQVIADDRLRAADGTLLTGANGGALNESTQPGTLPAVAVPTTTFDWYTDSVPTTGAIIGNISAAAVQVRASSVNDTPAMSVANLSVAIEDQRTVIGPQLNFAVSDAESNAFNLPVRVGFASTGSFLSINGVTTGSGSVTLPNGRSVSWTGGNTAALALTGVAVDIQTLVNDPVLGLAFLSGTNSNHDRSPTTPGDTIISISFAELTAAVGSDTGGGSQTMTTPAIVTYVDITAANDVPTVTAPAATVPLTGLTSVPGFVIADIDNTDGGALNATPDETDFIQVTIRITDNLGVPLAAGAYRDGGTDAIVIQSSNASSGATVDGTYDGTGSALVVRGTIDQVNAYVAGLQVQLGGSILSNEDVAFRVEVIADDRLRNLATGALDGSGSANGGMNPAPGGGTVNVPTTVVDPYGATPSLPLNVRSAYATVFPTSDNDPAQITYTQPVRTEGSATTTIGGVTITDVDSLGASLTAVATLPAGFRFATTGTNTLTLTGSAATITAGLNSAIINLPDPPGNALALDWNGSFNVQIVVNDNGNNGARPGTLAGDTDNPNANPGDYSYANGTTAALVTTRNITVVVAPLNDAPVPLTTAPATLIIAPREDSTTATASSVDSLFLSRFNDSNDVIVSTDGTTGDSFFGIAIIGNVPLATQGRWQYSLDGGATFTDVGARSTTTGLILDGNALLRFLPAANFFGNPNSMTVRLVENDANGDSGMAPAVNGETRDTLGGGGSTIFSATALGLSTSIANINDRPVASNAFLSAAGLEDNPVPANTVASLFSGAKYSDATDNQSAINGGGNAATALGGIAIVGNPANPAQGVWEYSLNGTNWAAVPAGVSDRSALSLATNALLRFVPGPNFNGNPAPLTVRVSDTVVAFNSGADLGDTATLDADQTSQWSLTRTVGASIAAQNDAPVLTGDPVSVTATENTQTGTGVSIPATRFLTNALVTDPDAGTGVIPSGVFGAGNIRVSLNAYVTGDELLVDMVLPPGVSVAGGTAGTTLVVTFDLDTTIAEVNSVLNALAFRTSSDDPTSKGTATTRTYQVLVNDGNNQTVGSNNAGGPLALSSAILSGTINVVGTNDAPLANNDVRSIVEDVASITGNVIGSGVGGDAADADSDNTTLTAIAVRAGIETGTGTAGTLGAALPGSYGALTLNANGSYTYALDNNNATVNGLKAGQTLTEVYTYTISDGAGGFDSAELRITIQGRTDGNPAVLPIDYNGAATGQINVFEHGLLDGIGGPDTTERNNGLINVSAADGLKSVTVGGTTLTVVQLQALSTSNVTIATANGVLVLTGFAPTASVGGVPISGNLSYTFTLQTPIANITGQTQGLNNVGLVVTDAGDQTINGTLVIRVVDDVPVAAADVNSLTEDGSPIATGNVVTDAGAGRDDLGADGAQIPGPVTNVTYVGAPQPVGTAFATNYGSMLINADGSYSFTLDNGNAAVNALKDGQVLTETVTYRISDSDFDTSDSTLTITINGRTDGAPSIVPVDGNGVAAGQVAVFERGLTSAGDTSETAAGAIAVEAADGLQSITLGGSRYTLAQLQALGITPQTIDTGTGTVVLTGFAPTTVNGIVVGGSLSYSYTLKAPIVNAQGATETTQAIALVVTDRANATATGTLTIRIVDDEPAATADTGSIAEDGAALSGNVVTGAGLDRIGADGASVGGPVTAVSAGSTVGSIGSALTTAYGSIVMNADGSFVYTLNNGNPVVNALQNGQSLTDVVNYSITDSDGDISSTTLTVTINGRTDGVPSIVAVDNNGPVAGQAQVYESGLTSVADTRELTNGTITIDAADGLKSITVGGISFTLAQLQALSGTQQVIPRANGLMTLTNFFPTSVNGIVTGGSLSFRYLQLAPETNAPGANDRIDAVALSVTNAADVVSNGTLSVRIVDDAPTANADFSLIAEDTATVSGNVVTDATGADRLGADGAAVGGPVSAVSFGPTAGAVGAALTTAFGSIVLNADGSYVYMLDNSNPAVNALKNGQSLTEVVNYTITDRDGDSSSTTLTITINGRTDGAPSIAPVDNNGAAAGQTNVFEHGLTSLPDITETGVGSITIAAADGLKAINVGGTSLTLVQLQALGTTPRTVTTPAGTLVLNAFTPTVVGGIVTGGDLSYSYTLTAPIANAIGSNESTDVIALVVTDAADATSGGSLTIRIVDDVPAARPDSGTVQEDGAVLTGNVVTAGAGQDDLGADGAALAGAVTTVAFGPTFGAVGTPLATAFGAIVLNADGSYAYTLDNGNATVNALKDGQTLTETVQYSITDKDGDNSTTTLTITINGHTDAPPSIVPVDGNGAGAGQIEVFEAGLTSLVNITEANTGTITVAAADGLASVDVGGTNFTLAQLQALGITPQNVATSDGTIALTGFAPTVVNGIVTGGTLSYSFTLNTALVHGPGSNEAVEMVALSVNDAAGISSPGVLTIRIVDDVPVANADTNNVSEDGTATISGNVVTGGGTGADSLGADGAGIAGPVTGVSFAGTAQVVGTAFASAYGTVTLNADGSYTYVLDNGNGAVNGLKTGQSLIETVTYTITDRDGDASTTTLTITINGHTDGAPTVAPVDGNGPAIVGEITVHETGLTIDGPAGESASSTGELTLNAPDGLLSIQVETTTVTLTQLQNLGVAPVSIDTGEGTLMLTGFVPTTNADGIVTGGQVAYSYTVKAPVGQPAANASVDTISLAVTDAANVSATSSLTAQIVDDAPTARADVNSVTEDGVTVVTGNVVTLGAGADRLGADGAGPAGPVTGVTFAGVPGVLGAPMATLYGSLVLNTDGSYSFTLNNNNATVNALKDGEVLTETVTYVITDADGDTSTATLTLTINGHTDVAAGPSIAAVDGNAASTGQLDVLEHGLTSTGDTSETNGGTVVISAADGLKTVTIGGVTLTLVDLAALSPATPVAITTPQGTLTLTGFVGSDLVGGVPTNGTVSYTYVLAQTVDQPGASESVDAIALVVTDAGNASASGTLTVRIVDDVPVAVADTNSVTEDSITSASGNLRDNDTLGADNANGVPIVAVSVGGIAGVVGSPITTPYGSIVINADGSYVYTLNNTAPVVQGLTSGESVTDQFTYSIIDRDGDVSTNTLVIVINGWDDAPTLSITDGNGNAAGQVTVNEGGLGDASNPSETTTGGFIIGALDGFGGLTVGGTALTPAQVADLGTTPVSIDTGHGHLVLTGFNPATGNVTYSYTLDRNQAHGPAGLTDDIAITLSDRDGDIVAGTLSVSVVDDVPSAVGDAAQVSTAQPHGTVTGNVVANGGRDDGPDRIGSDATTRPVTGISHDGAVGAVGVPFAGAFGTLTLNADGSYSYAVNDSNSRVASLGNGQTLSDVFSYTITDSDGSTSTAQLTITIQGATTFRPLGDQQFTSDFVTPVRRITQGMEPALFVQNAVRESANQAGELMSSIAMRAAGGLHEPGETELATLSVPHGTYTNIELVHQAVLFSQGMARDVEQTLVLRGLGRGMPDGANALFGEFSGFTALPAADAAAIAQEQSAPERQRIQVPAPAVSGVEQRSEVIERAPSALQVGERTVKPVDQARSFSKRLAAIAAERGTVRTPDQQPVAEATRVVVPAAPV